MSKKKLKCTDKIGFCWPWDDVYTNGKVHFDPKPKGLGYLEMTDIKKDERSRDLPVYVYGKKKGEQVVINFCPFCGANYVKLGRVH